MPAGAKLSSPNCWGSLNLAEFLTQRLAQHLLQCQALVRFCFVPNLGNTCPSYMDDGYLQFSTPFPPMNISETIAFGDSNKHRTPINLATLFRIPILINLPVSYPLFQAIIAQISRHCITFHKMIDENEL